MCEHCGQNTINRRQWVAGVLAVCCAGPAVAGESLIEPRLRVATGDIAHPCMALTLDACSGHTDFTLLDALIDRQIPATVFVTGLWLARNPQAIERLKAYPALFEIGNHGGRHIAAIWGRAAPYGVRAGGSPEAVLDEVISGEQAIVSAFGKKPVWYRGATAIYTAGALPLIAKQGYATAGYSLNGDVGASLSAHAVTQRLERAESGDVILAHLNHPERPCGKGLVTGLIALQARGIRFLHLGDVWAKTRASQL